MKEGGMAESTSSEKRQRRSDARERRRSLAAKPFEALDEAVGRGTLRQAATTAAAGAVAAGIAGAAKALADRRDDAPASDPADDESSPDADSREPQAQAEQPEQPEEPEEREEREEPEDDGQPAAPRGASTDEVKEIVDEAKRKLEELLGTEAEKVSGFHRSDGGWRVTLEVVNVRRIPDTTDVLSSYEVAFDDDRNLVSVAETRRYRRSQVEEGR
jgi:hypothetical protein